MHLNESDHSKLIVCVLMWELAEAQCYVPGAGRAPQPRFCQQRQM